MKDGTSLEWVLEIGRDDPRREFWVQMVTDFESVPSVRSECVRRGQCRMSGECECWLVPRLGRGILGQCLAEMEKMSPHKIAEALSPNVERHWTFIGSTVFSWTCGAARSIV